MSERPAQIEWIPVVDAYMRAPGALKVFEQYGFKKHEKTMRLGVILKGTGRSRGSIHRKG